MARKLKLKTNVVAPSPTYPFGRIKDDTGANDGTPVNEQVYGDFHQFFEKLLLDGLVTANNLPENTTNGFQYNQALEKFIRTINATFTEAGTVLFANLLEVISLSGSSPNNKVVSPYSLFVTPNLMHTETRLTTKIIPIGDWNMDTNSTRLVNLFLYGVDFEKIRAIDVMIRNNTVSILIPLSHSGSVELITSTTITLGRTASGVFDSVDFDSTSFNRGWITITYEG